MTMTLDEAIAKAEEVLTMAETLRIEQVKMRAPTMRLLLAAASRCTPGHVARLQYERDRAIETMRYEQRARGEFQDACIASDEVMRAARAMMQAEEQFSMRSDQFAARFRELRAALAATPSASPDLETER